MTRWGTLGVVAVVVLAGCTVGPFSTGAPLTIGNEGSDSYRVEVSIAQIGENVTVHWASGDSHEFDVTASGFGAESTPADHITRIDFPEQTTPYENYTLDPGEHRRVTIREVRQDETLFVVFVNEDSGVVHSFHGLHCRPVSITGANYTVTNSTTFDTDWQTSCGG